MSDLPLLWFANRATGLSLFVVLSVTLTLGIGSAIVRAGGRVPNFYYQYVHRQLSALSVLLLVAHVLSAVFDEYVDIRWWEAFSPVGGTYEPPWLGFGAVASNLFLVVVVTSLFRERIDVQIWRGLHWTAYLAWPISLAHGLGTGTDLPGDNVWVFATYAVSLALVTGAVAWRLADLVTHEEPAA